MDKNEAVKQKNYISDDSFKDKFDEEVVIDSEEINSKNIIEIDQFIEKENYKDNLIDSNVENVSDSFDYLEKDKLLYDGFKKENDIETVINPSISIADTFSKDENMVEESKIDKTDDSNDNSIDANNCESENDENLFQDDKPLIIGTDGCYSDEENKCIIENKSSRNSENIDNSNSISDDNINAPPPSIENNMDNLTETVADIQKNINESADDPSEEWNDVLGSGALLKKVLMKGSGNKPLHGEMVTISLKVYLEDNSQLIETHSMLKFVIGDGDVMQAVDLATPLMQLNEQCEVITKPKFAYRELGRDNDIPSNASLILNMKLLAIDGRPNYDKMPAKERLKIVNAKRERGNLLFSRREFGESIQSYTKAITILNASGEASNDSNSDLQELVDIKAKCYTNLAAAQLKVRAYDAAISSCSSALSIQPKNVKAIFRKAKAIMNIGAGDLDEAANLMRKAILIDPSEKTIQLELTKLTNRIMKQNKSQKEIYKKMFGGKTDPCITKNKSNSLPNWFWVAGTAVTAAILSISVVAYRHLHS